MSKFYVEAIYKKGSVHRYSSIYYTTIESAWKDVLENHFSTKSYDEIVEVRVVEAEPTKYKVRFVEAATTVTADITFESRSEAWDYASKRAKYFMNLLQILVFEE